MTPGRVAPQDRWQRVQEVFAAALELPTPARAAWLDRACGMDEALRQDVMSLLAAHDGSGAVDRLGDALLSPMAAQVRVAAPGSERAVGHYVLLESLGAGGMGVVHRARDERLGRTVALKFLSPHLLADEAATRRFVLEARAAAALEHPNVCTIHEIGEAPDGQMFIAMPLYDGETLLARLARGPLPVADAVGIASQMAAGLSAAHAHGIVHRDVKPSNVMVLPDGLVKLLDFGVAKLEDVTITSSRTLVGTPVYMSPEQIAGHAVDHRTDVWALGAVLYEMLTGERPFQGANASALMYAITTRDPRPPGELRHGVPASLAGLVMTALAKPPDARPPTMEALADALRAIELDAPGSAPIRRPTTVRPPDDETSLPPTAERRRVAVLATLVSDYALLVERLAPADLEEVIGHLRAAAVDTARQHGGLVNQALGEEIVSLFGIPAGHEDDDLRAVRAGVELHTRARTIATPALQRLGLTVALQSGIHSGPVVVQRLREGPRRFAVSGAPQAAARLAWLAGRDRILVSPDCQRLVGSFVETEPAPPVALDPHGEPVTPYRVVGDPRRRIDVADRAHLTPYTGRQTELSTLMTHLERACSGEGRILLVLGEAGMGKSRLLHELRARVRREDVRVLHGWCPSYGGVEPYLPFVELLRQVLEVDDSGRGARDIAARVRAIDTSLESFVPLYLHLLSLHSDEHPLPRHLQGEQLQSALLDAIAAILMLLAGREPLLLFLEDWHWADDASREALSRLAEVADAHRLAVVVTSRPEAIVVSSLSGQSVVVQLAPLDRASTGSIVRAVFDANVVSDDLIDRIQERAAGNPFFVEQVAQTLMEEGAVAVHGGEAVVTRALDTLQLPETVQAVIRARLDRLDGDTREVLRVASVIGREFSRTLLVAALGADADPDRALERLRAAGLVQQTGVVPERLYRFRHVLTHDVAYDSLLEHQRKTLHGLVADGIAAGASERLEEHADLLAHHFSRAERWPEAVRYGRLAAGRFGALSQYAESLAMLDRVQEWLEHLPEDGERLPMTADILLAQERLCETLGQRGRQQRIIHTLIDRLAPQGSSAQLAEAYLRQGDLLTLLKRFDAAERALTTVLRLSRERGDDRLERNVLRSLGLLRWHQGRNEDALAFAEAALAIDRARQDDLAIAADLSNVGSILRSMGETERARVALEAVLEMPVLAGDPVKMAYVLHHLAHLHSASGDLEGALACLERAKEATRTSLLPLQRAFHLTTMAHLQLQQGRLADALRTYEEAVELSRRARHADGLAQSLRMLGELQFGIGQNEEALSNLREAAGLFAQLEDRDAEAQAWVQSAVLYERLGAWEAAREAWAAARALGSALADRGGELVAVEGQARVARRLDRPAEAAALLRDALALATPLGDRRREAALHNGLGIIAWEGGHYDRALDHYEIGLRLCREGGDRALEGLMLNSLGVTLTRLHRYEEARTALEEGIGLNHASGERLLEAHALAALGDVSLQLGRRQAAEDAFERSLALRREIGDAAGETAMVQRLAAVRAEAVGTTPDAP